MAPSQVIEPKDLPPEVGVVNLTQSTPDVGLAQPSVDAKPAASILLDAEPAPHVPVQAAHVLQSDDHNTDSSANTHAKTWELDLESEAVSLLESGQTDVWDVLTRRFESRLIQAALASTKGRRIEAAQKLGIGRNTITRKIQELGLE
jgi:two-component system nitrogen regulation response regulator GlnG